MGNSRTRHSAHLPAAQQEAVAWRNATELFGLTIPASVQADPNAF